MAQASPNLIVTSLNSDPLVAWRRLRGHPVSPPLTISPSPAVTDKDLIERHVFPDATAKSMDVAPVRQMDWGHQPDVWICPVHAATTSCWVYRLPARRCPFKGLPHFSALPNNGRMFLFRMLCAADSRAEWARWVWTAHSPLQACKRDAGPSK